MTLGFFAVYCAVMGTLVVLNIPILEPYRAPTLLFGLLPLAVIGMCTIAYEKLRTP
jgi:hypothetical protein